MIYRIIFTLITLLGLFFLPWGLAVFLIIIGLIIFPFYLEAIIPLGLLDLLYAFPLSGFLTFQFFFTIIGLLLLAIVEYLRDRLVVYN